MSLFPVYLKLEGKRVVVIGGGNVAERKVSDLLQCGGKVTVISPFLSGGLTEMLKQKRVEWIAKTFSPRLLPSNTFLIIAATDDADINMQAYRLARERGILINVVDNPDLCDFYVPSVVRKGDITIAISSGGRAPSFSRAVRESLEELIPDELEKALDYIDAMRRKLRERGVSDRGKILLDSARMLVGRLMRGNSWGDIKKEIEEDLNGEI